MNITGLLAGTGVGACHRRNSSFCCIVFQKILICWYIYLYLGINSTKRIYALLFHRHSVLSLQHYIQTDIFLCLLQAALTKVQHEVDFNRSLIISGYGVTDTSSITPV